MSHQPAPAISSDQLAEQCGRTAMFASVWLVVWPLITLIDVVTGPLIDGLPLYLETLVITAIMVPLMVGVLLPFLTRRLQSWLVPDD